MIFEIRQTRQRGAFVLEAGVLLAYPSKTCKKRGVHIRAACVSLWLVRTPHEKAQRLQPGCPAQVGLLHHEPQVFNMSTLKENPSG